MPRFAALFRGINVGKAKRVAMADLRAQLEGLGYSQVRTLLNSGNAVFDGPALANAKHAKRIQEAVARALGLDALVIVKSAREIEAAVAGNPLGELATDPSRLLVVFTHDAQSLGELEPMAKADWGADRVRVGKHAAYVWCAGGILQSKAAVMLLKRLAQSGTTRNWSTLEKLHAMLHSEG